MYSSDEAPYGVYWESFGIGASTNVRGGTSTKHSTSTTINRCKGERGRHNYRPKNEYNNYSSSEPDYSSDEIPYEAPYETLYKAPYKTSDHGSSPHARYSAHSPSEYLEESSGEVEPCYVLISGAGIRRSNCGVLTGVSERTWLQLLRSCALLLVKVS